MRRKGLGKLCGFVLALMMLAQPILPTAKSVADIVSAHSAEAATTISKPLDENVSSGGKNNSVSLTNKNGEIITQNSITLSDKERADDIIETLQETGIVDKNGKMVDLDVRENGERTSLSALANRISKGEATGDLTVNGNSASRSQVVQLESMRQQLETANLLDGDVEITDTHVKNLESLLNDLLTENVEYNEPKRNAESSVKSAPLKSGSSQGEYPATKRDEGALDVTGNTYKGNYINGANYETNHDFELNNTENTNYYVDDRFGGLDAINAPQIIVTCPDSIEVDYSSAGIFLNTRAFNITVSLNKEVSVPVSFDYQAGGHGSAKGTISWNPGETSAKTFNLEFTGPEKIQWVSKLKELGTSSIILNLFNVKNAVFEDGKTTYSKAIKVVDPVMSLRDIYGYDGNTTIETVYDDSTTPRMSSYCPDKNGMHYRVSQMVVDWFPTDLTAMEIIATDAAGNGLDDEEWFILKPDQQIDILAYVDAAHKPNYYFNPNNIPFVQIGRGFDSKSFEHLMQDGKVKIVFGQHYPGAGAPVVKEVKIRYFKYSTESSIESITIPEATYYSGVSVPITIKFTNPILADNNTKLLVNGTWCSANCDGYYEGKELCFAYPVKDIESGSLNISQLTGIMDHFKNDIIITNESQLAKSFGPDDGVILSSDLKKKALDFTNAKYGVDDVLLNQTATVIVPINQDVDATWIANELVDIRENGNGIPMTLPGFGTVEVGYYLSGAYFSFNSGLTRYPAYVITSGVNETPVAIVSRYQVPANFAPYVRKDAVELYIAIESVTEQTKYLPAWENSLVDELGYHYFVCGNDTTGNNSKFTFSLNNNISEAPVVTSVGFEYFVKDALSIDDVKYITRTQSYELASDGYIKLENGNYVVLVDAEHPEHQYDVEVVLSEDLYNALKRGYARADAVIDISYQLSSRIPYTYSDEKYFVWESNAGDKVVFY